MASAFQLNLLRLVTMLPLLIVLFAFISGIESPRLNASAQSPAELTDEDRVTTDNDA